MPRRRVYDPTAKSWRPHPATSVTYRVLPAPDITADGHTVTVAFSTPSGVVELSMSRDEARILSARLAAETAHEDGGER